MSLSAIPRATSSRPNPSGLSAAISAWKTTCSSRSPSSSRSSSVSPVSIASTVSAVSSTRYCTSERWVCCASHGQLGAQPGHHRDQALHLGQRHVGGAGQGFGVASGAGRDSDPVCSTEVISFCAGSRTPNRGLRVTGCSRTAATYASAPTFCDTSCWSATS